MSGESPGEDPVAADTDGTEAFLPAPRRPERDPHGHKGTFGLVLVVGGSANPQSPMIGAPTLAARAAIRAGAGLVRLAMPAPIALQGLGLCPWATGASLPTDGSGGLEPDQTAVRVLSLSAQSNAIVLGPGLGGADSSGDGLRRDVLAIVRQTPVPIVLDADGLNALSRALPIHDARFPKAVLTPHPGEFARLASALGIEGDPTDPWSRPHAALQLAGALGCVCVLKGAGTVVSDGDRVWRCERGHACLATGGTGDVLAGLLGGLIAQFAPRQPDDAANGTGDGAASEHPLRDSLFELSCLAVEAHARAGERWAEERDADAGLLADELADLLPPVLNELRAEDR